MDTNMHIIDLPLKMEPTQFSETSAFSIQTPGIHPKENLFQIYISCYHSTKLSTKFNHFLNDIFMSMLVKKKHKFPNILHKIFEHSYCQYLVKIIKVALPWWTSRTLTKPPELVSTYAHGTAIAQQYRIWQVQQI
jgi:hypothetical protein